MKISVGRNSTNLWYLYFIDRSTKEIHYLTTDGWLAKGELATRNLSKRTNQRLISIKHFQTKGAALHAISAEQRLKGEDNHSKAALRIFE